jgi:hypothetical protein
MEKNMKTLLKIALPVVLLAGSISMAHADNARSWVKSVDTQNQSFKLKNGLVYSYGEDIDVSDLQPGTKVKVNYRLKNNQKVVKSLRVISQPETTEVHQAQSD